MRVLYMTLNNSCGSTNAPLAAWIKVFHERGVGAVVVCRMNQGPIFEFASRENLPAYSDPMPLPDRFRPWAFVRSLWALRRIARRHRVDLIHCNEHNLYPLARLLGRWIGKPVIVSVHFQIGREFSDWALAGRRQPARMVFVSRSVLEHSRAALGGGVDENRWCVVPNGLDLERYVPDPDLGKRFRAEHGIGGDELVIGVACMVQPRKQIEHLVEAAERLARPNLRVLVAGRPARGHEGYGVPMLEQIKRRLGERLIVLGHLTDLRGFYGALDLFVNTSQQEACSISVLESMACGCPVIGYASKSVDEQVLPGGGEIVEQDNVDQLVEALTRWLDDPARRLRAAAAARRRVEEHYDVKALAQAICEEYQAAATRGTR